MAAHSMSISIQINRRETEVLLRRLRTLGEKVERKVVRKALSKAATPIARAMRKLAPKGSGKTSDGRERKHLKQTITKSLVRASRNGTSANIKIGPEAKKSPHAHLVEFGTKQRTRKRIGGKYSGIKNPSPQQLRTGAAPEQSFLRRAFKQERSKANSIIVAELRAGIEREARS